MNDEAKIQRTVLPIPDPQRTGLITYDAKDPESKFPPIRQLRPPKGASNVLIVLYCRGRCKRRSPRLAGGCRPHCHGSSLSRSEDRRPLTGLPVNRGYNGAGTRIEPQVDICGLRLAIGQKGRLAA